MFNLFKRKVEYITIPGPKGDREIVEKIVYKTKHSKFSVDQEVYLIVKGEISKVKVVKVFIGIDLTGAEVKYNLDNYSYLDVDYGDCLKVKECRLSATKEELIEKLKE